MYFVSCFSAIVGQTEKMFSLLLNENRHMNSQCSKKGSGCSHSSEYMNKSLFL